MVHPSTDTQRTLRTLGLALLAILLLRTAWVSDEAYLTLRSVEHAASGFGLRWNVSDRVQVYDHPLWMLVLLAGRLVTGDTYYTTIGISIAASLAAVWIVVRPAATDLIVVSAVAAAALSPLFLTFSTSGLEPPLLHVLVAAFVTAALAGRSPSTQAFLAGLLILTHWATVFLVAPVLLPLLRRSMRQAREVIALSGLPVLGWLLTAWWYYGTLGSNLQLANRTAGAMWRDRAAAGWSFVRDTAQFDPLLVGVCFIGVYLGFVMRGTAARIALGSGLAIGWAVLSGGSDMAGRHLTASFVVGAGLGVRYLSGAGTRTGLGALVAVLIFALMSPVSTLTAGANYGQSLASVGEMRDPRAVDYRATGLLRQSRLQRAPNHPDIDSARAAMVPGGAIVAGRVPGMVGFAAGPAVHVVDRRGRVDPLLARLPPAPGPRWPWRADRRLPEGYGEALPNGTPVEPALDQLTRDIRDLTRGSLVSFRRLTHLFRLPARVRSSVASSSYGTLNLPLDAVVTAPVAVPEGGVVVRLPAPRRVSRMTALMNAGYDYQVQFLNESNVVATVTSPRANWHDPGQASRELTVTPAATATAIRIRCGRGFDRCVLGQVALDD